MIEVKNAAKRFAGTSLPFYQNVTIPGGEIVGVLGENGSGKTTMLKTIMGLGELDDGVVLIDGKPAAEQYDKMALITEEGSFFPEMTPLGYGLFLADFFPRFQMERYDKLLRYFEIESNRKIKTFSRGQKSKLEISAGFAKDAKYILMDEPFLGKDLFTRRDFLKLMVSTLRSDETILLATHSIEDIENVIDRAIILRHGLIKADFYIDEIRREGKDLETMLSEVAFHRVNRQKQLFD